MDQFKVKSKSSKLESTDPQKLLQESGNLEFAFDVLFALGVGDEPVAAKKQHQVLSPKPVTSSAFAKSETALTRREFALFQMS